MGLVAVATLSLLVGCSSAAIPNPRLSLRYDGDWRATDVDAEIRRAGSEDVAVANLGHTAWVSHHVAVVRTSEKPHYHRFHDMTVFVLRGEGVLTVEQKQMPMKMGDVVHVPRGTPHFFRNTGESPAVAAVVFSPPFDGRDTVSAPEGADELSSQSAVSPP
jgi:mannose-6-phosphate isomerase-like protein (cupin superfamily)